MLDHHLGCSFWWDADGWGNLKFNLYTVGNSSSASTTAQEVAILCIISSFPSSIPDESLVGSSSKMWSLKQKRLVNPVGEGEGETNWESSIETYTLPYVKQMCCSVAQLCPTLCDPMDWSNARPPCSCPLHWWCHTTVSSSGVLFSFCPQSFR